MSNNFARPLKDQEQVDYFLKVSLGLDLKDYPDIHYEIIKSEKGIIDGFENPTSTVAKFRDREYATEAKRLYLRKQIVEELFTKKLLDSDDDLILGKGGAVPEKIKKTKDAFLLIGLPASGKSGIAVNVAQKYGAIILDSDFAKRKLPEYDKYPWGASIVHAESSLIVFGDENKTGFTSLYAKALQNNYNVVIPKIGAEPGDIVPYCETLKSIGYKVHLTLVYLQKEKATIRALQRFQSSKRYVPLSLIFDVYGNNPALTYFLLKNKQFSGIESYGIVNNDVAFGLQSVCTDLQGKNPAGMFRKQNNSLI